MYEPEKGVNFYQAVNNLKDILLKEGSKDRQMKFNDIYVWGECKQ
jgi:hypothetical protein